MPVPIPRLDDRSFQDLVDEVIARIPAHTPEWTNPQPGDPGRTLIELFAWLTDTLLYRVNLVPERQRLAFLRLLNIQMRSATAARTLLSVNFDAPDNTASQWLPELTPIKGPVPFESLAEITVLPIAAETYYKRRLSPDESSAMEDKIAALSRLYLGDTHQDGTSGFRGRPSSAFPYITTPTFPDGKADPVGFDLVNSSVDQTLWFALLAPKKGLDVIDAVTTTLGKTSSGGQQHLNVGISPLLSIPSWDDSIGQRVPVPYVWELTTPVPGKPNGVAFLPLTVVADTTSGLTTNGTIRLALPGKSAFFAPTNNVRTDVDAGTGDKPPRLDDPTKNERLVAWLRLRPTVRLDSLSLTWVGINCVPIDQRQTMKGVIVGQGNGQSDQKIQLPAAGIEEGSFGLQVEEAGRGFLLWQEIDDLAVAAPQAAVFELDAEAGTVTFGDGVRGKIPARGARIRVAQMRVGGGAAGNLPVGTLTQVQPLVPPVAKLKAFQPLDALGGQNAETLDEAQKRIPALFRHRDRAVTADDYRQLASTTAGVQVGRAEVLPGFKPQGRRSNVPGVVSVMVLPSRDSLEAPYPRIDRPFVETVNANLEAKKPLGTELYVIGCEYVSIGITVGIDNPGGHEEVNTAVKKALQSYLFCLPPYGPHNQGWPLGRTVKRRELEVVVSRVEGVEGVEGPNLFVLDSQGAWVLVPNANDNAEITLHPWQLPELVGVVVADGTGGRYLGGGSNSVVGAPSEFKPPTTPGAQTGLQIPVVPEVC